MIDAMGMCGGRAGVLWLTAMGGAKGQGQGGGRRGPKNTRPGGNSVMGGTEESPTTGVAVVDAAGRSPATSLRIERCDGRHLSRQFGVSFPAKALHVLVVVISSTATTMLRIGRCDGPHLPRQSGVLFPPEALHVLQADRTCRLSLRRRRLPWQGRGGRMTRRCRISGLIVRQLHGLVVIRVTDSSRAVCRLPG